MAGNESTFTVIVDKTLPAVTLKKWMSDNNHIEVTPGNHNYYVLAEYSDANLESAKLDGNDYESGALITGEGEHTLIVRDMAGNETPITFTIDRTYPVVKINGESFDHDNQDIKYYKNVEVEIIEENIDSITLTKDGNTVEYNNEYVFEEGKYALTVRDTAKNKTVVNFVVDHTAPSMIVGNTTYGPDHEGIIYSSTRFKATASDLNGVKEIYTNGHLRDKIDVSGKGKYIFRLVDMAGNESIFTVILVDLVIDSNEDLVYAIKNQADNQKWIIKSGNYTLNRNFEDEYGAPTSSQTGWFFPITANNLTITGEGTVSITAGEDAENGVWSSQNFVTIFGDGVTIDNITFVPHVDPIDRTTNKSIEIIGNNVVLKDINIEPKYETSSGSIYVGSKGIITTLENVNLNKGRISLTGADSTNVLNLINVIADFAGALNEDYLGYWNPNGAKVNIENFKVTVSDALSSDDLNDLVANVPAGTIIFMKNGEYNLGHLEINNSIILTGESKENTIINVDSDSISGQAGIYFKGNGTIENLKVKMNNTGLAAIKASFNSYGMLDNVTIQNVIVEGGKSGINIHGVKNAVIDNVEISGSSAVSLSVASSDVTLKNSNLELGGWGGSIGIMYDPNNLISYPSASVVHVEDNNTLGIAVYAEYYTHGNKFEFDSNYKVNEVVLGTKKIYTLG